MFKSGLLHIALHIGLLVLIIALLCMGMAALWKYLRIQGEDERDRKILKYEVAGCFRKDWNIFTER